MKKIIVLFFISITIVSTTNANQFYKQRMKQIYLRIRKALAYKERKRWLNNKHVVYVNLIKKDNNKLSGFIRLKSPYLFGTMYKSSTMQTDQQKIHFKDIKYINFTRWKIIIKRMRGNYLKHIFIPSQCIAKLNNGKTILLSNDSVSLLTTLYLFKNNGEILTARSYFTLYYDVIKKKYYNHTKKTLYFLKNPLNSTVTKIKIIKYYFDRENANRAIFPVDDNSTLKMRTSESQEYFNRMRKQRLKREREQQQREAREERERQIALQKRRARQNRNSR